MSEKRKQHLAKLHADRRAGLIKTKGYSRTEGLEPAMSFTEIGKELSMTRQGAEQCYRRAMKKLERGFRRYGLNPQAAIEALRDDYQPTIETPLDWYKSWQ